MLGRILTKSIGDSEHAFHDIHNHISLRLAIWPNFHLLENSRGSIQLLFNCQIKCVINLHASKFCMKLDRLILKKIIKIVATRCQILRLKCTKFDFGWGSLQRSPRPPSWISGATSKGREGKGREGEGSGREGKRGDGRYKGSLLLREEMRRGKGGQGKGEGEGRTPWYLLTLPDIKS